jgi:hypothetical protein
MMPLDKAHKEIHVRVGFADGDKFWPGWESCSPYFAVASRRLAPSNLSCFDVIHKPTGVAAFIAVPSKRLAFLLAGIVSGLPFPWQTRNRRKIFNVISEQTPDWFKKYRKELQF